MVDHLQTNTLLASSDSMERKRRRCDSNGEDGELFVDTNLQDMPIRAHQANSAPATTVAPHSATLTQAEQRSPPVTLNGPRSPLKTTPRRRRLRSGANSMSGVSGPSATSINKLAPEPIVRSGNRTIYTQGRPPWYDADGHIKEPFVIGICGGSSSGKTTVAKCIIECLDVPWVSLLSMDSFYKVLTPEQKEQAHESNYNFDHPAAFDIELLLETLKRLREGRNVHVPIYDFNTHSRLPEVKTIYGANVIIFEGIMSFVTPELLELLDLKVFVDTDSDERLARRLRRDIAERGRELSDVLVQYNRFVKPAYEQFIAPTMTHADIIVPRGGGNQVAIDLIVQHVNKQLETRGTSIRKHLMEAMANGKRRPETLHIVPPTRQLQGLLTFIRNCETPRDEFIFYSNRLMRLLCEFALSFLPYETVTVETPQGVSYEGRRLAAKDVCGVSIVRAGETLEPALCAVCKDVRLGKILIQTNRETQEPELHYIRLHREISKSHVMLMDSTVATGAAAIMAIRVLQEHDVPQERITLVSLLMSLQGVQAVAYAFPNVRIVTTAVDEKVNEQYHIVPGIGNFGDRYFGTD